MFGMNSIEGKKLFRNSPEAQAGKLLVTSMFMTLQGEGPYRGEPAFFIRLAKCNLACSFCDTYFDSGQWLSVEEIAQRVDEAISKFYSNESEVDTTPVWAQSQTENDFYDIRAGFNNIVKKRNMVLVITGGEPTIQENLLLLLEWGEQEFEKTQIESNGIPVRMDSVPASTTVVISPKCAELPNGAVLNYITPHKEALQRADCLKFVMAAPWEDWERGEQRMRPAAGANPYSIIPAWAHEWAKQTGKPVFVSPMNIYKTEPRKAKELRAAKTETTIEERSYNDEVISFWEPGLLDMEANRRNHEYAASYAIKHGFIFNVQIHLLASVA